MPGATVTMANAIAYGFTFQSPEGDSARCNIGHALERWNMNLFQSPEGDCARYNRADGRAVAGASGVSIPRRGSARCNTSSCKTTWQSLARFNPPKGICPVQPCGRDRLDDGHPHVSIPRRGLCPVQQCLPTRPSGPDSRCFNPPKGIMPGATEGAEPIMRSYLMFQSPEGDYARCNVYRGGGPALRAVFQSPEGDYARCNFCEIWFNTDQVNVSIPRRGLCPVQRVEGRVHSVMKKQFQSPEGDYARCNAAARLGRSPCHRFQSPEGDYARCNHGGVGGRADRRAVSIPRRGLCPVQPLVKPADSSIG